MQMNEKNPLNLPEFKIKKLARDITNVHDLLVVKRQLRKVPEQTFINEILPFYAGEATSEDTPLLVAAAAGGPFLEFEVIDQTGNVLFVAPPLLARQMFSTKEYMRDTPLEAVFITAGQLANRSPRQAEHFINERLTKKNFSSQAAGVYSEVVKRRDEILARYGRVHVDKVGKVSTPGSNSDSSSKPEIELDDDIL